MTDQHSRALAGCYGNSIVRTPNLDRLASQGMVFENTYCPSPLCVPSRMSFMTSRTPSNNRVWANDHILSSGAPTWAHYLGIAGYRTALVGRMHFEGADLRHGFEERPIGEYSACHPGSPERGGPRFQAFPRSTSGQSRESVEIAGHGTTSYGWFDRQVTDEAVRFLGGAERGDGRPFAAVVGYVLPHCPFIARRDLFEYYYDRVDEPLPGDAVPPAIERFQRLRGLSDPPLSKERIRVARAAYFALVEEMDQNVGQVLDALDASGLAENTVVFYTSDHGETAGDHGCWWKSTPYEGSAGVPLIVRYPRAVSPGSRSTAVCNLMDLGPTFVDIAGNAFDGNQRQAQSQAMKNIDGRSLLPVLSGDESTWENTTWSELVDGRGGEQKPWRMIRHDQWKLTVFADSENLPPMLFNLETDPDETTDLSADPEHASLVERLTEAAYNGWDPALAAKLSQAQAVDYEVLRAWGRAVEPPYSPETLALPPEGTIETDITLLPRS